MGFNWKKATKQGLGFISNPTIAGAALGVVGDIYGAEQQRKSATEANEANVAMSREQMDFQERMSNSAHVREVADLRNAGLNPILSADSGASSPSGSMATIQPVPPVAAAVASSARDAARFVAEMKEITSRIKANNAGARDTNAAATIKEAAGPRAVLTKDVMTGVSEKVKEVYDKANTYSAKDVGSVLRMPQNKLKYMSPGEYRERIRKSDRDRHKRYK